MAVFLCSSLPAVPGSGVSPGTDRIGFALRNPGSHGAQLVLWRTEEPWAVNSQNMADKMGGMRQEATSDDNSLKRSEHGEKVSKKGTN